MMFEYLKSNLCFVEMLWKIKALEKLPDLKSIFDSFW